MPDQLLTRLRRSIPAAITRTPPALVVVVAVVLVGLVAAAVLPRGLPVGVIVQGLVIGGLTSFTAMALVLVYRAARIVNFAAAGIGSLAGAFAYVAVTGWKLPYVVGVAIGVAVAVLVGIAVDATVIRRLRNAPRLILTVATIGVFELLAAAQFGTSRLTGSLAPPQAFHSPLSGTGSLAITFNISPLVFTGDDVVAMVVVPLVLAGVWWFLFHTEHGVAIRAVADSHDRAVMLGVPSRRVSRIVWMVAAGLSGIGAILATPILQTQLAGSPATPIDLLPALAAFALAGFESLTEAVVWSLVIGVVQQGVFWSYSTNTYADVALFGLMLVGLALRKPRRGRSDDRGLGEYVAVGEVHRIPEVLARLPEVRIAKALLAIGGLAAAVLVPLTLSPSDLVLFTFIVIYAIVGVSLVVVTGWSGQVSLGQFAFVGIGSTVTSTMLVRGGADLFVAFAVSAVVTGAVASVIGLLSIRLPGLSMGVITLAFAVVVSEWLLSSTYFPFLNPSEVGRPTLFGRFDLASHGTYYEFCLAFLVLALLVTRNLRRSRTGRAIIAVRDNERGAAAFGINPWRTKVYAFSVSGAIAGVAGGLYVVALGGLGFGGIDPLASVNAFVMVVIGGLGSMTGAVLGAFFVQGTQYFLSGGAVFVALGLGLLIPLMVFPQGLGGAVHEVRDYLLRLVARWRNIPLDASMPAPSVGGTASSDRQSAPLALPSSLSVGDLDDLATVDTAVGTTSLSSGANPPLVIVEDAHVYIGQVQILDGVALDVEHREVLALLGTNGSGKSTTLKAIAGLLPLRRGRVLLDGKDISGLSPEARVRAGIVMVPGGNGVFPSLTVEENFEVAGWVARRNGRPGRNDLAKTTQRVHNLFPKLAQRWHVRAGDLSGGEQQMLAIAQSLLCMPRVLMIDELSLGLAPSVVAELIEVVRALAASGVTVVVVEQSFNVATDLSTRAIFLERGRVHFSGPTAELEGRTDLLRSVFLGTGDIVLHPRHAVSVNHSSTGEHSDAIAASGQPTVALAVQGVNKSYGGISALNDVELHVHPGEILGIIGSNGAGKTTLFDVCSGFTSPDFGCVLLGGEDVTAWPAAARAAAGLGRLFQNARLYPSLTVAETVAVSLERSVKLADPFLSLWWTHDVRLSEEAISERVGELLFEFALEPIRDRFISELSTGTRRIVELACAVGHRPSVLFLDEPTSGLAQRESEALGPRILELRQRTGASFVVVEHDVPMVSSIADRLVCLHLGEVIAEGDPQEVLAHPAVLASYLGDDDIAIARSGSVQVR